MVTALLGVVSCGGSSAKARTAAPTTAPPTAAASSAGPASTTGVAASSDRVAVALDKALLTPTQVQAALGLPTPPGPQSAGPGALPQGPLDEDGVLGVLPDATLFKSAYDAAGGGVGANVTYDASAGNIDIDIAAVKFATASGATSFNKKVLDLATTLAQGRTAHDPGLALGVLPVDQQVILRVPPSVITDPSHETVIADLLYSDGALFVVTMLGPPGTITDAQIVALAHAQDAAFTALRPSLGIG